MTTTIPRDILVHLFQYLTRINEVYVCTQVCQAWYGPAIRALYLLDAKQERRAMKLALEEKNAPAIVEWTQLTPGYISRLSELRSAIRYGRTKFAEAMLNTPIIVEIWRRSGHDSQILLLEACLRNNLDIVLRLLEMQSSSGVTWDYTDCSPLVAACAVHKDSKTPRVLYRASNQLSEASLQEFLLASYLPGQISPQIVSALLQAGYPANTPPGSPSHPLHLAVDAEDEGMASLLIKHGADVNFKAINGYTPLSVAIWIDSWPMIQLLTAHGADWHFLTDAGSNALHMTKSVAVTKVALEKGVPMEAIRHAPPKVGRPAIEVTPLMRACERGISEVAMFLIEQGANIHVQNKGGFTLVHSAACAGMVDVLKAVLDRGLDINGLDWKWRWSALHRAASLGDVAMAEVLLSLGADVNVRSGRRGTPFLLASTEAMIRLLVSHGAAVDCRMSTFVFTRLHALAGRNGLQDKDLPIMELLLQLGASPNTIGRLESSPVYLAIRNGTTAVLKVLLAYGAEVDKPGDVQWTPLMYVCANGGDIAKARLLLEAGANVNAKGWPRRPPHKEKCITPLLLIAELPHSMAAKSDLVKLLLDAGADLQHTATYLSKQKLAELVDILLQLGYKSEVEMLLSLNAETSQEAQIST
ncbi:hypothetical protein VHEMI05020 [[Torrubiella] hemipterigena]|uniref:Uncharacterized protein n=1 Tax=[Torrubiella] hemipterigena TaxID=1531966 RepID=A0A0A1TFN3_9HYPO|nr:hypothetical protein VHEMI05020 [[Torrubiella] hemipterigena]